MLSEIAVMTVSGPRSSGNSSNYNPREVGINAEFLNFVAKSMKYEYIEKDKTWIYISILICITLSMLCLFLNGSVLAFYYRKRERVIPLMYSLMSIADMVVPLGTCLTVNCLFLYTFLDSESMPNSYINPAMQWSTYVAFFISSVAIRTSIFLNITMSIIRTIGICQPFIKISKILIIISLALWVAGWSATAIGEILSVTKYCINEYWSKFLNSSDFTPDNYKQGLYTWYFIFTPLSGYFMTVEYLGEKLTEVGLWRDHGHAEVVMAFVYLIITFVAPSIVTVLSMGIQLISLKNSSTHVVGNAAQMSRNRNDKRLTKTIILLTTVFFICNTSSTCFIMIACYTSLLKHGDIDEPIDDDNVIRIFYHSMFFCQCVVPLINSTLNAFVMVMRGKTLKKFLWYKLIFRFRENFSQASSSSHALIVVNVNRLNRLMETVRSIPGRITGNAV